MSLAIPTLTQTSNLLVTLNSSVNFIIYIIYGEKFQRIFLQMFCHGQNHLLRRYTMNAAHGMGKNGILEDSPKSNIHHMSKFTEITKDWKDSTMVKIYFLHKITLGIISDFRPESFKKIPF